MEITELEQTYSIFRAGSPEALNQPNIRELVADLQSSHHELGAVQISKIENPEGVMDEISIYAPEDLIGKYVEDVGQPLSNRRGFFIPNAEEDPQGTKGIKAATRILGEMEISIVGIPCVDGNIILIEDTGDNFNRAKHALENGELDGDYMPPAKEGNVSGVISLIAYPEPFGTNVSEDPSSVTIDIMQEDHTLLSQTIFAGKSLTWGNPKLFPENIEFDGHYALVAMGEVLGPELTGVGASFLDSTKGQAPFISTFNTDFGLLPLERSEMLLQSVERNPDFQIVDNGEADTATCDF